MKLQVKLALIVAASTLISVLGVLVLVIVLGNLFIHGYDHEVLSRIQKEVEDRFAEAESVSPSSAGDIFNEFASQYDGIEMELVHKDGTVVYSASGRDRISFEELAGRFMNQPYSFFAGEDVSLLHELDIGGDEYFLIFAVEGASLANVQFYVYMTEYRSAMLFLLLPLLLVTLLPALLTIAYIVTVNRRIHKLHTAMKRADLQHPPAPPADRSNDEIGELNRLFYDMSLRLHEQYATIRQIEETRKQLVSNLSHDLGTPLATIIGYAETLQQGPEHYSRDQAVSYSSIVLQRAEYIRYLLDKLFEITLIDQGVSGTLTRCDFCEMVREIAADYVLMLEDQEVETQIQIPDAPIWVEADEYAIGQSIRNLIDNAVMYGGDGRYLGLEVEQVEGTVCLSVSDKGKGIPPEQKERIFERFVRLDKGRKIGGIGIGLTIAREIVEKHGGRIIVLSEPYRLTTFTIELPIKTARVHGNPI